MKFLLSEHLTTGKNAGSDVTVTVIKPGWSTPECLQFDLAEGPSFAVKTEDVRQLLDHAHPDTVDLRS